MVNNAFDECYHPEKLSPIYKVVVEMDKHDMIRGNTNRQVYDIFLSMWDGEDTPDIISVSKFITKYFKYKLMNKKINGVKYRIFIRII